MDNVYFYGHSNGRLTQTPWLSNFYKVPNGFEYAGFTFTTSEHALMYAKATLMGDEESAMKIKQAATPLAAKRLGRKVKPWDQTRWDAECEGTMREILIAKFSNPEMKPKLLSLMGRGIYEASPRDKIWGIGISVNQAESGVPHKGRNLLGKALMAARDTLSEM